jgi:hypothetical protein
MPAEPLEQKQRAANAEWSDITFDASQKIPFQEPATSAAIIRSARFQAVLTVRAETHDVLVPSQLFLKRPKIQNVMELWQPNGNLSNCVSALFDYSQATRRAARFQTWFYHR